MPATSPALDTEARADLGKLGELISHRRKALRVSAVAAAESAGMSRVTLHRIEHGEPAVTMGAYLNALHVLGLQLQVVEAVGTPKQRQASAEGMVRIDDYPQLRQLAWQLREGAEVTGEEALAIYERNWRHVDEAALEAHERELIDSLVARYGKGHLLV
ncbi:helix-turn-helix domain-containing protein [Ramlibacter albus]|uniref:Helix-turn-helix domain-containing protein n=1 Tax=Ramlibacter albus TaxID=2079448 RepID=A0A923M9Z7_9BURK|nr:helix-turn-helix domain-containing protein [Ramlibacter albus]MBC5766548.1 helix-turn-helix domain-containing protein [Ramlibacter albus]